MSVSELIELPSHKILSQLAHDDPQAFEELRREVIDGFINRSPARISARLHGIQFRVDNERRLSRSALGSTVRIYKLMWDSFLQLNDSLQDFVPINSDRAYNHGSTITSDSVPKVSAKIFEFQRLLNGN